ncbi:hypothetical protein LMG27177_03967 [Paraburkholderia fynbosensis]|uniref:Glycine zipper domain-containing protein n=2 Tax=Paraburkholderia fynbosensis TaxID=1200993 RepID=A0A6J5G8J0_9BURK|nr:hypothetical protein LMG27177_03967 [Paraburkholderia fynbosensis]
MNQNLTSTRTAPLLVCLAVGLGMAGCAVMPPSAPTVMAVPANGKTLNQFQQDDYSCRNYATQAVNPAAASHQAATSGLATTAVGTAGGAAAGALIGAGAGNAGAGAAIGAGAGLLLGSMMGSAQHNQTEASLQQQYDNAYAQCITARGDTIETPRPAAVVVPVRPVRPRVLIYGAPPPYYYAPY